MHGRDKSTVLPESYTRGAGAIDAEQSQLRLFKICSECCCSSSFFFARHIFVGHLFINMHPPVTMSEQFLCMCQMFSCFLVCFLAMCVWFSVQSVSLCDCWAWGDGGGGGRGEERWCQNVLFVEFCGFADAYIPGKWTPDQGLPLLWDNFCLVLNTVLTEGFWHTGNQFTVVPQHWHCTVNAGKPLPMQFIFHTEESFYLAGYRKPHVMLHEGLSHGSGRHGQESQGQLQVTVLSQVWDDWLQPSDCILCIGAVDFFLVCVFIACHRLCCVLRLVCLNQFRISSCHNYFHLMQ